MFTVQIVILPHFRSSKKSIKLFSSSKRMNIPYLTNLPYTKSHSQLSNVGISLPYNKAGISIPSYIYTYTFFLIHLLHSLSSFRLLIFNLFINLLFLSITTHKYTNSLATFEVHPSIVIIHSDMRSFLKAITLLLTALTPKLHCPQMWFSWLLNMIY